MEDLSALKLALLYLQPVRDLQSTRLSERRTFIFEIALLCRQHNAIRLTKYLRGPFADLLEAALRARFGFAPHQMREHVWYAVDLVRDLKEHEIGFMLAALDVERVYRGLPPFWSKVAVLSR